MINKDLLEDMSHTNIKETDRDRLKDIREIEITGETIYERWESYLAQVGNPYCFRVGKTPVKISFKPCEETLDMKIRSYFLGLKN